ncbi:hypothetical protein EV363DRAFT_792374 [Boletus edulis]|nr:hypothetical protein EV363DRAFT_792374 [Boletus edulis]
MLYLIAGAVAVYAAYQYFFGDDRDDRPPSRPRTYKSSQPPVHRRDERQQRQSIDSSRRDDITPEEVYASLRARAKQEGDLMAQCYQQSKEAYERRDRARAKALSDEGKRHALKMETLNADASTTIFKENNRDRDACEVDLHGLFVKEAIVYSEKAVSSARQRGYSEIRLIVGQGNHSEKGIPRLKPALQEDMQMRGHHVEADPKNPGVLVVQLGSR